MTLLSTIEFREKLINLVEKAETSITIFSAFIKKDALLSILEKVNPNVKIKIISRWNKLDLIQKASDREVYTVCHDRNWQFGVNQNLHGKLILVDNNSILMGSANITSRGLGFVANMNLEFGLETPATPIDLEKINNLNNEVTWLDDALYKSICEELEEFQPPSIESDKNNWSKNLFKLINKPLSNIWIEEIPKNSPEILLNPNFEDPNILEDVTLLNLDPSFINKNTLIDQFKSLRVFTLIDGWIVDETKFGEITAKLHGALLNKDPSPYRKHVKDSVKIIFDWFAFIDDEYKVNSYTRTNTIIRR